MPDLHGRLVAIVPDGSNQIIIGTVTGAEQTTEGVQLTVSQDHIDPCRVAFCTATADYCRCLNRDCDGTHRCDCGGSWSGQLGDDDFVIHRLPSGAGLLPPTVNELVELLGSQVAVKPRQSTPIERALAVLRPHLSDEPLYRPTA